MKKDSIIIYSGGLDSTTLLYQYKERIAIALSFNYGSKHNAQELRCAAYHCKELGIKHIVIELAFMQQHFHSSLLQGSQAVPEADYAEDNMRSTVVPFRNGIMLAIAAGMAEDNNLKYIMMANHGGDHTLYPDCRPAFVDAMSQAMAAGTWNGVQLFAPYTDISKAAIVRRGKALGIDYSKTWSCYKGGEHHCGECATCRERREALAQAGLEDMMN